MPTFEEFIQARPELELCSIMEQKFEYELYIDIIQQELEDINYRNY